jgi:hypothetical protein
MIRLKVMVLFPYNLSDILLKYLRQIDEIKAKYLLLEISPAEERRLRFETECFRLYYLTAEIGERVPKNQLIHSLGRTRKEGDTVQEKCLSSLKYFISGLSYEWVLSSRRFSPAVVLEIADHFDHHAKQVNFGFVVYIIHIIYLNC